ncbi:MAG: GNAT family N-acetyltransferase [Tuberibacillus sp.]
MITITHEHVDIFLKQPTFEELDYVAWLWSDEKTMEPVGGVIPFPEEKRADWYRGMVQPGDGRNFYCLIYTSENEKVGEVSFHQFDETQKTAHLNVKIAHAHRGHHYGKKAVLLLLDFYFNMFGGEVMLDDVVNTHSGAKHVLTECGFEELAAENDIIQMSISKERFDMLYSD